MIGEIVLISYISNELEIGMLFINRISVGVIEPYIELFELEEIPDNIDEFMSKHGCPIELAIIDEEGDVVIIHDEIGWMDDGNDLREITLNDVNIILKEYDGYINIEVDEDDDIILYDDKIVLSLNEEFLNY
jgi:hypothetical protein